MARRKPLRSQVYRAARYLGIVEAAEKGRLQAPDAAYYAERPSGRPTGRWKAPPGDPQGLGVGLRLRVRPLTMMQR